MYLCLSVCVCSGGKGGMGSLLFSSFQFGIRLAPQSCWHSTLGLCGESFTLFWLNHRVGWLKKKFNRVCTCALKHTMLAVLGKKNSQRAFKYSHVPSAFCAYPEVQIPRNMVFYHFQPRKLYFPWWVFNPHPSHHIMGWVWLRDGGQMCAYLIHQGKATISGQTVCLNAPSFTYSQTRDGSTHSNTTIPPNGRHPGLIWFVIFACFRNKLFSQGPAIQWSVKHYLYPLQKTLDRL